MVQATRKIHAHSVRRDTAGGGYVYATIIMGTIVFVELVLIGVAYWLGGHFGI